MVFHHQLLCGAELFVALGSVRVGANEYGRPQISIDKSVGVIKRGFVLLAILWVLYFGVSILSMPFLITRPTGTS